MGGANTYDNFDTSSVITSTSTSNTVSIGKYSLRKREVLLGGIAIAALVGVVILAIVLAVRSSDKGDDSPSSNKMTDNGSSMGQSGGKRPSDGVTTGGGQGVTAKPTAGISKGVYCETTACLKASVYQKPIMNEKMDPCEDFYSFACGHYSDHHQQSSVQRDVTAFNEITNLNVQRLVYMLSDTVKNTASGNYEMKLKEFMYSCENHFDKMELRGKPLIDKIITPLGGWWLFDEKVVNNFNLQNSLNMVHNTFWTSAFFNVYIRNNMKNWNHKIVELGFGGLNLRFMSWYTDEAASVKLQTDYKNYLKELARLLSRDHGMPVDEKKVTQFSEDAFEVERMIARTLNSSSSAQDPHHPDSLVTLDQLNDHLKNSLDMVNYMRSLFNEYPGSFDGSTKVAVAQINYFNKLGEQLYAYLNTKPDGKRKLHNYLMARVITIFSKDLSWEYVHASRKLTYNLYQFKDTQSGYVYCFREAETVFTDALNALFIKKFVKEQGKAEAEMILDDIKELMVKKIANLPWMSITNRDYAIQKIRHSLYKIGFPSELTDEDYLHNQYSFLDVDPNDFFGNIINTKKMFRHLYNSYIGKASTRTEWAYHVFTPIVEYYNPWTELIATSAMLQNPLFSPDGPKYYNYGGVGSILASNLIHAIDEIGANFKEDGSKLENWWTNTTRDHYAEIKRCAIDAQAGSTFSFYDNMYIRLMASRLAYRYAPQLLSDSSGIRLSYLAYKNKESREGKEILPPGFSKYDADQMFFISYAQTQCQNTPDPIKMNQMFEDKFPSQFKVNIAMKQIPEFQRAFDCPAPPSHKKSCLLFP